MVESVRPVGAPGVLVLAGTPIGDPQDASPRLVRTLAEADVIAAEDTRRFARLVQALGIVLTGRVLSYHEHNEAKRTPELVAALQAGQQVVVVTDAGMPSVSDPGFRLVQAAADAGVRVTAVPGPSAVLTALAVSGLPVARFCFEGFLPRKSGERAKALAQLAVEPRTMVFFEAPHRLSSMLAASALAFGADRSAAICRELTKTYEEVIRGSLLELATWAEQSQVRGEITVVIEGAPLQIGDPVAALEQVQKQCAAGVPLKVAVTEIAAQTGLSKRELYEQALTARAQSSDPKMRNL